MSRNGTGIILSNIAATSRHFRLSVFIVLALSISLSATGCTFLEQFKKKSSPAGSAETMVDRRSHELLALEGKASYVAPEELGAARVVLDEMSYFESQGESEEVTRLDDKMAKTLDSIKNKASGSDGSASRDDVKQLQLKVKKLEREIVVLNDRLKAQDISAEIENGVLLRRLEVVKSALTDAEQEVVRIRSRIQGMASQAEASAMFAEARVLIDRMVEEAYREQALEEVELAEHYLRSGKDTLDQDNPAGAAFLFDRVSEIYTSMIKSEPRVLTVKVRSAALRSSSSESSKILGYLSQGDSATGQKKAGDWVQVKTPSGLEGWIRREQVQ
jgi:hypothetical protein